MVKTGALLDYIHRNLDNDVSASEPVADMARPQLVPGKKNTGMHCKAVRSRVAVSSGLKI